MNVNTLKKIISRKNKVNYLSGLWLNFDISIKESEKVNVFINDVFILRTKKANSVYGDVNRFDLYLPVLRVANAINGHKEVTIAIKDNTDKTLTRYKCYTKEIYKKEFEYIGENINFTLSSLPLISESSIQYLEERQILSVITHLIDAKLEKDSADLLNTLVESLNHYSSVASSDELAGLQYRADFIALLINSRSPVISNPYYFFIKKALSSMMYLDAKSLIDHSKLEEEDKSHLYNECVKLDADKFAFAEHFPLSDEDGLKQWLELSEQQKQDYWPLLANGFEYRHEYKRITKYPVDYSWYTNDEHDIDSIKVIIQDPSTRWFGMSLIVNEFENGATPEKLLDYLQEYVWANWDQEYLNIDSFCYVANSILPRLNGEEYSWLTSILMELFNSRVEHNVSDIHRQCLIVLITQTVNQGIRTVNDQFGWLAEKAHQYYAFDDYFLSHLDYSFIKAFDSEYYRYAKGVYSKVKAIKCFVNNLSHNQAPSVNELREQIIKLTYLRDQQIQGIDKWILALSRYCQLLKVSELYQELSQLHEAIGDMYGALKLASSEDEKWRLEYEITTSSIGTKRKDSYWFERSLEVRLDPTSDERVLFIEQLHGFLSGIKDKQAHYADLIHLLASEITHYLMQGGSFEKIEPCLSLINQLYVAGHSAILITNWLVNQEATLTTMNHVAEQCGEYGEFVWFVNDLGQSTEDLYAVEMQNAMLQSIKQRYVYPYLQVMIYSCNAYENTRHKIIRESWLPTLKAMDIDYCIVVGGADKSYMDDDIMRLAVSDTYEALPHKSIEMFCFANSNSHHRYYYKLDDDCVLNVYAMFGDPTFLNQAYFGRVVRRALGGVDRSWHHKKSSTQEAKTALDLSPEYSQYCDGSTGYILNEWAVEQLVEQVALDTNTQLIGGSYFEDKLIGDLMNRANVHGVDTGYRTLVKRTFAGKYDKQIWEYGLHASRRNNIKVVHTESDEFRLHYGSNLESSHDVELLFRDSSSDLTPEFYSDKECAPVIEKLSVDEDKIRESKHVAIIVGKNEQELLPNLLKHHRAIGIEHFLFVDNCSDDTSIDYMMTQDDVSVFIATQEYRHSRFAVNWQETLLSHYGLGRWMLIIDSDELYTFKGSEIQSLYSITQAAERENANSFFAPMIDFYPKGELSTADVTGEKQFYEVCAYYDSVETMQMDELLAYGPYSNSKILHGGLRERIFGRYNQFPAPNYLNQKYNLVKFEPNMQLTEGLHFMYGGRVSTVRAAIMHFKYHAGFYAKVLREIESGQHWNGATEYKRYIKALETRDHNILFDNAISLEYRDSLSFFGTEVTK